MRLPQVLVAASLILASASSASTRDVPQTPAYILQLPEETASVFIADTGNAVIYRYARTEDGSVALAGQSYLSIGQNGVGKQRAWDRKTPLGIYFVVDQLDTRLLHEKYGVTAFPLDYPGPRDRQAGRSGNGIWVHGVLPGGGQRPELDTDGCLALPNEDLEALSPYFVPQQTAVIVAREMQWVSPAAAKATATAVAAAVDRWLNANNEQDLYALLDSYSHEFTHRGLSYDEWMAFLLQTQAAPTKLRSEELLLLSDPEEPGLYVSRFRLTRTGKNGLSTTPKRLYWRLEEDGIFRIVAEDNG